MQRPRRTPEETQVMAPTKVRRIEAAISFNELVFYQIQEEEGGEQGNPLMPTLFALGQTWRTLCSRRVFASLRDPDGGLG